MSDTPASSTCRVLIFGQLRDVTQKSELQLAAGDGITAGDIVRTLTERWPALAAWDGRLLIAVNLDYATADTPVPPGAEVAIMPPVQGG